MRLAPARVIRVVATKTSAPIVHYPHQPAHSNVFVRHVFGHVGDARAGKCGAQAWRGAVERQLSLRLYVNGLAIFVMPGICVPPSSYVFSTIARTGDGSLPVRPASEFAPLLKAQANAAVLPPACTDTQAPPVQAANLPRRLEVDAMLLLLLSGRKMVLTAASKTNRSTPVPTASGATAEECMLAGGDRLEGDDLTEVACSDGNNVDLCTGYA